MSKVINVDQVKLSKVSVDIQVIRVGSKQMTLAVFEQLVRESLIDWETLQLRGIPWGWVNRHNKECGTTNHLHIIWQAGNHLLRDDVYQRSEIPQEIESRKQVKKALADAAAVYFLEHEHEAEDENGFWKHQRKMLLKEGYVYIRFNKVNFFAFTYEFDVLMAVRRFLLNKNERSRNEVKIILRNKYKKDPNFQELLERVKSAAYKNIQVRQKWEEIYTSLKNLPQLFIAV